MENSNNYDMPMDAYPWYKDVLGSKFVGQFVATLVDVKQANEDSAKRIITLDTTDGQIKILRPQTKGWDYKFVGDKFIVTKAKVKDRGFLYASDAYQTDGKARNIGITDIYELIGADNTKPNIVSLKIMDIEEEHYIMYSRKKIYRIPKTFKLGNPYGLDAGIGKMLCVDLNNEEERKVDVLGLNYNDARIKYMERYGQSKHDKESFEDTPVTQDKYAKFHVTRNIELVHRNYTGLILLEPIELVSENGNNNSRKYMYVKINDDEVILLSLSKKGKWNSITGNEALVVRKRIYPADDGKALARLSIIDKISNYNDIEEIELKDMLIHKHGIKPKVDMEVIYISDEHIIVYAEENTYKILKSSIQDNFMKRLISGEQRFRIKPNNKDGHPDIFTLKTQTRPIN